LITRRLPHLRQSNDSTKPETQKIFEEGDQKIAGNLGDFRDQDPSVSGRRLNLALARLPAKVPLKTIVQIRFKASVVNKREKDLSLFNHS
jgi:hypothetical protein